MLDALRFMQCDLQLLPKSVDRLRQTRVVFDQKNYVHLKQVQQPMRLLQQHGGGGARVSQPAAVGQGGAQMPVSGHFSNLIRLSRTPHNLHISKALQN